MKKKKDVITNYKVLIKNSFQLYEFMRLLCQKEILSFLFYLFDQW